MAVEENFRNQLENVNGITYKINFNSLCSNRINLFQCQDLLKDTLQANETMLLQNAKQLENLLYDYVCQKGAEIALQMRSYKINKCYDQPSFEVNECMKPFVKKYNSFLEFYTAASSNQCADLKEDAYGIKNCILDSLRKCSIQLSQIYADVIQIVFDFFMC